MNKPSLNSDKDKDKEKEQTDLAWFKLQAALAEEPENIKWAAWGQNTQRSSAAEGQISQDNAAIIITAEPAQASVQPTAATISITATGARRRRKMSRRSKWATAAAGVAVFAAILATPVGNTAMAAILNQFRMQEVTVVDESDLRNIFDQVNGGKPGNVNEMMNKFGSFSDSYGLIGGKVLPSQVKEKLGYSPPSGIELREDVSAYINFSRELTMRFKIDEVNDMMKRLGATELLPQSVDDKPITLHIPETVSYELSTDQDHWASLSQMNTPTVHVDPSIEVEEALAAVVEFPLLPDYMKTSLQQSRILSGEIPMPLVTDADSERISVNGTPVILQARDYSEGMIYSATWSKDGQIFSLEGGTVYPDKEKFMAQLQELITS
ncbi:hypothetical protein [Paenibacillus donghaensis]|uniref:DUF4367 domain-containing protein n=1 Tax=Paenibacillus donghaensis TaxID=414771 RepID=A0A2Z2KGP2_9BACL|nr:hypothetical protein [Paenibacillus donghaensis]ASA21329.1 hypothetical protein B9T62_11350 [Paenibacillus donghaensis]